MAASEAEAAKEREAGAASRGLETGRKWRRPREAGEVGRNPFPLLPGPQPEPERKWKYKLSGLLHLPPPTPPASPHPRTHTETKREGTGGASHQLGHISSPERPGRWSLPGPAASERKGRGFLLAPLPRSSLLQSRAAASLTPCASGPGDSYHLLPAPAPSSRRPSLGQPRSLLTSSPPPRTPPPPSPARRLGANEERRPRASLGFSLVNFIVTLPPFSGADNRTKYREEQQNI